MSKHLIISFITFKIYYIISAIGLIALILFNLYQIKKADIPGYLRRWQTKDRVKLTTVLCFAEAFFLVLSMNFIPSYLIANPFGSLFHDFTAGENAAMYFGWIAFALVSFFIMAFLLGMKPLKTLDLVAPGFPLALIFAKIACFFAGCCTGFKSDYGFYNRHTKLTEFPVQLVESAEALVIFIILLKLRKKAKLGTMYPIYLMLYSGMRFCSEFLRAYPDCFGHFKIGHILALSLFFLGALETVVALKFGEKIDGFFSGIYSKTEQKLREKFRKNKSGNV